MLQDHGYGASASYGVPVYAPVFAGTKFPCLVTGAHGCEQLAQSCYSATPWPGLELVTPYHCITTTGQNSNAEHVHKEHMQNPKIYCLATLKGKGSPYSITEHRVPELIPGLGSQPAGDVSYKPGGRLPLLSARHALTPTTLKRADTILLLGEQTHDGCEHFA